MLPPYERLGLFYLGRRYDLASQTRLPDPVLYDSKDLVTHGVCIGMTGSGKTGLGVIAIEEAALDGVPVLAIDPKGDLANLLLTFPELTAAAFAPWVDAGDAAATAQTWKRGLAEWDQDESRIQRLKAAADVRVYTPGSRAGIPLSLLNSLAAGNTTSDEGHPAGAIAASLLALAGIGEVAPHSREQALVATILATAPAAGADIPWLVQQIQRPSFDRVGVLDLETFYPARDRQELALRFNSVLASPGFALWSTGEPLDVARLLYGADGRPRVSIISVAHLDDAQRMMAVSLVLEAIVQWSRRQAGTSSLRALVYMDEVFGFLPPVANPPSKLPLLTLLKQARAAGVGVLLATQNPVDLDYKALGNSGTWFLGKLQTERDKARVLDGLHGASSSLTREQLDAALSALRTRVFLMHNVHEQEPVVFETRWTLSYLRGPLTRDELRRAIGTPTRSTAPRPTLAVSRPVVPAGVDEYFLPGASGATRYEAMLYGSVRVRYTDARRQVDLTRDLHVLTPVTDGPVPVDWAAASETDTAPEALARTPGQADAAFEPVPAAALNAAKYTAWARELEAWIVRDRPLRLFAAPAFGLHSRPDETEPEFRVRVEQAAREVRDAKVEQLRARYAPRVARAAEKIERASQTVAREQQQVQHQKLQTAVSFGATLVGALMGRKAVSLSTLGRATTAARGAGRTAKEAEDVERARGRQRDAEADLQALEAELQREIDTLTARREAADIDTIEVPAKRTNVDVRLVALAWKPVEGGS